jgi:hypothetical protein
MVAAQFITEKMEIENHAPKTFLAPLPLRHRNHLCRIRSSTGFSLSGDIFIL